MSKLGRLGEARALLLSLDYDSLSADLKYDHCFAYALTMELGRAPLYRDCNLLKARLDAVEAGRPLFVEQVRELQLRLEAVRHAELEGEVSRLVRERNQHSAIDSDDRMRLALARQRALPPQRQTMTDPFPQPIEDYLIEITVHACSQLVDNGQLFSRELRSLEDSYTAYVVSLLQQRVAERGWHVGEQNLGGRPANSGPERGRRDLVFRKGADAPFGIVEALRCSNMSPTATSSVNSHLVRLLARYDPTGSAVPILLVYSEVTDFPNFYKSYVTHFESVRLNEAPLQSRPAVRDAWQSNGLIRSRVKLLLTTHQVHDEKVEATHVIVQLPTR